MTKPLGSGSASEKHALPSEAYQAIAVNRYEDAFQSSWDEFVRSARNGTLYHTRRFLQYHPPQRFADCSVFFVKRGRWIGALPATLETESSGRWLSAHPGASYGGLVIAKAAGLRDVYVMLSKLVDHAREQGLRGIKMLRVTPHCYQQPQVAELEFALTRWGFELEHRELSSAIDLTCCANAGLAAPTARSIRKAQREGVVVKESTEFSRFWVILNETLSRRHGARPTHSVAEIELLRSLLPDQVRLFAAHWGGRLIAGAVVFACNERCYYTMYVVQDFAYKHLRPMNLLFFKLIEWGIAEGFRYMDLGVSTERLGRLVNWDLFRFKEGFGAHGVLRDSYRLTFR